MTKQVFAQYKRDIKAVMVNTARHAVERQINSDEFREEARKSEVPYNRLATEGLNQFFDMLTSKIDQLEDLREKAELDDERPLYHNTDDLSETKIVGVSSAEYLRLDEIIDEKQEELAKTQEWVLDKLDELK